MENGKSLPRRRVGRGSSRGAPTVASPSDAVAASDVSVEVNDVDDVSSMQMTMCSVREILEPTTTSCVRSWNGRHHGKTSITSFLSRAVSSSSPCTGVMWTSWSTTLHTSSSTPCSWVTWSTSSTTAATSRAITCEDLVRDEVKRQMTLAQDIPPSHLSPTFSLLS